MIQHRPIEDMMRDALRVERTPIDKVREALFRGVEVPEAKGACSNCGGLVFPGVRHSCGLG